MTHCPNCGTELAGQYCHACGQRVVHLRATLHDFLHEATHEFLHVDGKIVRTVRYLLFAPGRLTRDFLDGKRARYISPLRMYLVCSALFFFLAAAFGAQTGLVEVHEGPRKPASASAAKPAPRDARFIRGAAKYEHDPERLALDIAHAFPKAMFILMPIFAVLLWLFERKRERFYIPHLYFSIHFHAFAFALFALITLMGVPRWWPLTMTSKVMTLLVPVYLFGALRTVYGDTRGWAFAKTLAISAVYLFCVLGAMLAILFTELNT